MKYMVLVSHMWYYFGKYDRKVSVRYLVSVRWYILIGFGITYVIFLEAISLINVFWYQLGDMKCGEKVSDRWYIFVWGNF